MITRTSRYFTGPISQILDPRTQKYTVAVKRKFPDAQFIKYFEYVWKDGDQIDQLAAVQFRSSQSWHLIMDINPEIHDPFNIAPGTVLRIPRD